MVCVPDNDDDDEDSKEEEKDDDNKGKDVHMLLLGGVQDDCKQGRCGQRKYLYKIRVPWSLASNPSSVYKGNRQNGTIIDYIDVI